MKKNKFLLTILTLLMAVCSYSQLRLPAILSSGMVLQQNDSVSLWGWAGPSETVRVMTSWSSKTFTARATDMATWKLKIPTPAAGGPHSITIVSRNKIVLSDILIGEVWVCSGQSNMEWSYFNGVKDINDELPTALNSNIRFFNVPKTASYTPQDDVKAQWTICDSNTIKSFSAVGYFFGKKLQKDLNVPIGLVNASWGGTPAETWTPMELVQMDIPLKQAASQLNKVDWWPTGSGQAFNAMIYPLTNYTIAGAIWYQGESNTNTNSTYKQLFTTMIDSWRDSWHKQFPFYYVQIAPYTYGNKNVGALLQEQQTLTMSHPNTGMVVITDLIDSVSNIHPSRKKPVGERLANWALAETYKKSGISYKSPQYVSMQVLKDKISLQISNASNGLVSTGKSISGFFIAGADQVWVAADAKIENDRIIVSSKQVKEPVQVRYGFGNTIIGNIASKEGLPLCPFRTDRWVVDQSAGN